MSIIPLALLFVNVVTCAGSLSLNLNNLHPARLSQPVWPYIYNELVAPISEDIPTLFTEKSQIRKVVEWIGCIFPGSEVRAKECIRSGSGI